MVAVHGAWLHHGAKSTHIRNINHSVSPLHNLNFVNSVGNKSNFIVKSLSLISITLFLI